MLHPAPRIWSEMAAEAGRSGGTSSKEPHGGWKMPGDGRTSLHVHVKLRCDDPATLTHHSERQLLGHVEGGCRLGRHRCRHLQRTHMIARPGPGPLQPHRKKSARASSRLYKESLEGKRHERGVLGAGCRVLGAGRRRARFRALPERRATSSRFRVGQGTCCATAVRDGPARPRLPPHGPLLPWLATAAEVPPPA